MTDYIEWDGTDKCLESLLIWWGTREPFEHSDNCKDPRQLHCCEGKHSEEVYKYGLESIASRVPRGEIPIAFTDNVSGTKTRISVGDKIYYRGNYNFELVKK